MLTAVIDRNLEHPPRAEIDSGLHEALLVPLQRRSQRQYALQYLRGLLSATGRKTIRKIAAVEGTESSGQALHHFISESPWAWDKVRSSMARHLDAVVQPSAWVVAAMVISKSGNHSVGVESIFVPDLGGRAVAQRAYGVWLAREEASYPVNWRIHLPDVWLEERRRRQARIPEQIQSATIGSDISRTILDVASWGLKPRPVVIDAREADPGDVVSELSAAGQPFLLKVRCSTRVLAVDAEHGQLADGPVSVLHLAAALRARRSHVTWMDPRTGSITSSLAGMTRVRLPGVCAGEELVVLCEWQKARGRPSGFWLSSLTGQSAEQLTRLGKLALQVTVDTVETGADVGLRDFEGRTYRGWHHHMTLASAAHASRMLASAGVRGYPMAVPVPGGSAAGTGKDT